ncbi:hypothetical protein [Atopobium sp. oral taxon 810]|uniref:hypothetical protein n=1 Tax=Atopobium sp. oral taxon 810 TaxID=712158 RepID=UPI0012EB6570|nr:hypothetical protein [Atopobium sp. oral taxon 810]
MGLAPSLWIDLGRKQVKVKHYDARMVISLTWDVDGVVECAFCTQVYYKNKPVDWLQMYVVGELDVLLSHDLLA